MRPFGDHALPQRTIWKFKAVRCCQTSVSGAVGKKITIIEGLGAKSGHPLQKAWIAEQVPQCAYCQSGQIMQAASLPSDGSAGSQ